MEEKIVGVVWLGWKDSNPNGGIKTAFLKRISNLLIMLQRRIPSISLKPPSLPPKLPPAIQ